MHKVTHFLLHSIPWNTIDHVCVAIFYIVGSLLSLTAAIGLFRFPNTLMRMHATAKPLTLGIISIVIGTAIYDGTNLTASTILALTAVFTLLTAPAAGHRISRVVYFEQYHKDGKTPETLES